MEFAKWAGIGAAIGAAVGVVAKVIYNAVTGDDAALEECCCECESCDCEVADPTAAV